jgi:hypothetical protein
MTNKTLNTVVAAAKAKAANHPEWLRAVEKAAKMLATGELCVTLFADNTALVTSPNGSYRVNGTCPCAARTAHCYHRAAKRLVEMMETTISSGWDVQDQPRTTQDVVAVSRESLIADIERMWPANWPPLAVELMARFRCNDLNFLADDMLQSVRLAIAA